MSEPPEFTRPPARHPSPGPRSYPGAENSRDDQRIMAPFNPRSHTPSPNMESNHASSIAREEPAEIGIAISSNSEPATPSRSQPSQRTLSELLPDKPELCAEPLRLIRQASCRRNSVETLFEEDALPPTQESSSGSADDWTDWPDSTIEGHRSSPYNNMRMLGLPSNPRVLKQGFGDGDCALPDKVRRGQRANPVLINGGRVQPSHSTTMIQENTRSLKDHRYWQDSGGAACRRDFGRSLTDSAASKHLNSRLEPVESNPRGQAGGCPRNSVWPRPITPAREGGASANNAWRETSRDSMNNSLPGTDFPVARKPAHEVVSKPRIVRGNNIKRVQIQRGKPQPTELKVPYSPDDYWLEHRRGQGAPGTAWESVVSRKPGNGMYSQEEMRVLNATKPLPPLEHNLTLSKRGADLILHVD